MLLPEKRVRKAITHPEPNVRLAAVRYFTDAWSTDEAVMPRVIEAAETHGRKEAFSLLREAANLPQSPPTLEWLLGELREEYDPSDLDQDNHRFAIGLIVQHAEPGLLADRREEIRPLLPESLREAFDERMRWHGLSWEALWEELKAFGRELMPKEEGPELDQTRRLHGLVEAIARHPDEAERPVLDALRRQYRREERELMEWLEPEMIRLAGAMRLERAIPLILRRRNEDNDAVQDEIVRALGRIGTEEVVQQINPLWWKADWSERLFLAESLGHIHSDLAVERALRYLERERDSDLATHLARAALSHFDDGAIEPVRDFILEHDPEHPEIAALRRKLAIAAQIIGVSYPEHDEWYAEATGEGSDPIGLPPYRLSKTYHGNLEDLKEFFGEADDELDEDEEDGAFSLTEEDIDEALTKPQPRDATYELRVELKEIDPPIWRRLRVPDCTLDELHMVIQSAMGWEDAHDYSFWIAGVEYSEDFDPHVEWEVDEPYFTRLSDAADQEKRFTYIYDFGDHWEHKVRIGKQHAGWDEPAVVLAGERACPLEDIGGPPGYYKLLEVAADPDPAKHQDFVIAKATRFDPDRLDLERVNRDLAEAWKRRDVIDLPPELDGAQQTVQYPVGTVAYYGPDEQTTTKLVASVIRSEDAEPILRRWVGTGVAEDPKAAAEIERFFQEHGVRSVVSSGGNIGCPHEEGEDFPLGEECPFCPAWHGKQGLGGGRDGWSPGSS